MVDDQLDRLERVDLLRVAPHPLHGVAHRGEVDDRGDAGEVLEQDAARPERDLADGIALGSQSARPRMSSAVTVVAVLVAEQVFQQDLERERQASEINSRRRQGFETIKTVRAIVDLERRKRLKAVGHRGWDLRKTGQRARTVNGSAREERQVYSDREARDT